MGLRTKFNLALLSVLVVGLGATGFISYTLLQRNARDEVVQRAGIMMEAALAVRSYTTKHVRPHLEMQLQRVFLPQATATFAALETFTTMRERYPEYFYREVATNPLNPRNRAVDWEEAVLQDFRKDLTKTQAIGERETATGRILYLARPMQILDKACLSCHGSPADAPATLVKLYGDKNGFGWQEKEIVASQIVTVPMSVPIAKAQEAFRTFILSLLGIFAALFVIFNLMLHFVVVRPLGQMAQAAEAISTGMCPWRTCPPRGKTKSLPWHGPLIVCGVALKRP